MRVRRLHFVARGLVALACGAALGVGAGCEHRVSAMAARFAPRAAVLSSAGDDALRGMQAVLAEPPEGLPDDTLRTRLARYGKAELDLSTVLVRSLEGLREFDRDALVRDPEGRAHYAAFLDRAGTLADQLERGRDLVLSVLATADPREAIEQGFATTAEGVPREVERRTAEIGARVQGALLEYVTRRIEQARLLKQAGVPDASVAVARHVREFLAAHGIADDEAFAELRAQAEALAP